MTSSVSLSCFGAEISPEAIPAVTAATALLIVSQTFANAATKHTIIKISRQNGEVPSQ